MPPAEPFSYKNDPRHHVLLVASVLCKCKYPIRSIEHTLATNHEWKVVQLWREKEKGKKEKKGTKLRLLRLLSLADAEE